MSISSLPVPISATELDGEPVLLLFIERTNGLELLFWGCRSDGSIWSFRDDQLRLTIRHSIETGWYDTEKEIYLGELGDPEDDAARVPLDVPEADGEGGGLPGSFGDRASGYMDPGEGEGAEDYLWVGGPFTDH